MIEDMVPPGAAQAGMLYEARLRPHAPLYVTTITCGIEGRLDPAAFRAAWERVAARHEPLRAGVATRPSGELLHYVVPEATVPWVYRDLQGAPDEPVLPVVADAPIDVDGAPLFRVDLDRLGPERFRMRWSHHHVILDGRSASVVLREVLETHARLVGGELVHAGSVVSRLRPFATWLDRQERAPAAAAWREHLGGAEPTRAAGRLGAAHHAAPGCDELRSVLPGRMAQAIEVWAGQNGTSANAVVGAAWAAVVRRETGIDAPVTGLAVDVRGPEQVRDPSVVGMFVNTVPIRWPAPGEATLADWARSAFLEQSRLLEWAWLPLPDIHRAVGLGAGSALFDSLVGFEDFSGHRDWVQADPALSVSDVEVVCDTSFPLVLMVEPGNDRLFRLRYDRAVVTEAHARRLLGAVVGMLGAAGDRPDLPVDRYEGAGAPAVEVSGPLLCSHHPQGQGPTPAACPPGNRSVEEVEAALVAIWRDVLDGGEVRLDDRFFDIGGDSIRLLQLARRVSDEIGPLTPVGVFEYPTVRSLARFLVGESPLAPAPGAARADRRRAARRARGPSPSERT